MKRAHNCSDCKHFGGVNGKVCGKGHRPRFYAPQTIRATTVGNFGWKRRCDDFERDWRVAA
jgi:hypothetical protein